MFSTRHLFEKVSQQKKDQIIGIAGGGSVLGLAALAHKHLKQAKLDKQDIISFEFVNKKNGRSNSFLDL